MSSREKKLLLLVIGLGALALIYFFLYIPFTNENESLRHEVVTLKQTLESGRDRIANLPKITEELVMAKEGLKETANKFYGNMDQEDYIAKINALINNTGIIIKSISYNEDIGVEMPGEGSTKKINEGDILPGMRSSYALTFETSYKRLITLVRLIDTDDKTIVNKQINVNSTGNAVSGINLGALTNSIDGVPDSLLNDTVNCTMAIDFYYLSDMDEFTIAEDYMSEFEKTPLNKTRGISPFKRVNGQ